jgi:hypothetical protein
LVGPIFFFWALWMIICITVAFNTYQTTWRR